MPVVKKDTMQTISGYDYAMSHPDEIGKHLGKWILIFEGAIVASDIDLIKIYRQFQKDNPKKVPFIMKFPKEPNMLL